MEENESLNGMPLPLLMERARKETMAQVRNIMARYQMPAFLYTTILIETSRMVEETAAKEKEEAEQYWLRKQAEVNEKNSTVHKEENESAI